MHKAIHQSLLKSVLFNVTNTLNDTYSDTLAAGAINGTLSDSGHQRFVVDANSKVSMASGNLIFATGSVTGGATRLWYNAFQRKQGLILLSRISNTASVTEVGFDNNDSALITNAVRLGTTTLGVRTTATITTDTVVSGTTYDLAQILHNNGSFEFVKGGVFTNWTLFYSIIGYSNTSAYPSVCTATNTTVSTVAFLRVPNRLYTPTPLVSDSFTNASLVTDGLGFRGVYGGNGVTWTQVSGAWQASAGTFNATSLSSGVAIATLESGKLDIMVSCVITHVSGTSSIIARYTDANNHVRAAVTGTNVQLIKVVAGTSTTVVDVAITAVAGAELRLHCHGTEFRVFYNEAAVGSATTISDSALQTGTKVGVRTSSTSNLFSYFYTFNRGMTDNAYSILDSI